MLLTLPPVTNCHTFSDPSPSSVTYFMDGPFTCMCKQIFVKIFFVRSVFSCVRASYDLCAHAHAHSLEGTLPTTWTLHHFFTSTTIIANHKTSSSPGSSICHRAFHSKLKCHLFKHSYPDPCDHSPSPSEQHPTYQLLCPLLVFWKSDLSFSGPLWKAPLWFVAVVVNKLVPWCI